MRSDSIYQICLTVGIDIHEFIDVFVAENVHEGIKNFILEMDLMVAAVHFTQDLIKALEKSLGWEQDEI